MKKKLFVLTGPTGSGKTSLSVDLAAEFPIEIVNADSLQIFRFMDIGTAKPVLQIREKIPHHLIDVFDPDEETTAAWYSDAARRKIDEIHQRGKIPLVVGGAGFYLQALFYPPTAAGTTENQVRSIKPDYEELKRADPVAAEKIHPNDTYRIQRALAVIESGDLPSREWRKPKESESPYDIQWMAIALERNRLYGLINDRVARMFQEGLIEETTSVVERFPESRLRLMRAIGYRQALDFLEERIALNNAMELAKQKSRNYAKRQMTWFRKIKEMNWIDAEKKQEEAKALFRKSLQQ